MTLPPLPDINALRITWGFELASGEQAGSRHYMSYTGGPPTATDLNTYATDIATAWNAHIAPLCSSAVLLNQVIVQDIATYTGLQGTASPSYNGSRSGSAVPVQVAFNLQFLISRHYRGGKPKMYLPAGTESDLADQRTWSGSLVSAVQTDFAAYITAISGVALTSFSSGAHINLSYYFRYTNYTPAGERYYSRPTYRTPNATHDLVSGYKGHTELSSQRRRRESTTI